MMTSNWIRGPFFLSGVYDIALGVAFIGFGPQLFDSFQVPPPNHFGYVQFPALLLVVFGLMFLRIARDPVGNRALMPYGIGLKLSYCGVVFYHMAKGDIPAAWVTFAYLDVVFLLLFFMAYRATAGSRQVT